MRKITAILRRKNLQLVKERLQKEKVSGITVSPVKGYGEYKNCFGREEILVDHVKLEVFAFDSLVDHIRKAIMESARTGLAGDGLVAIIPVDKLYKIRTMKEVKSGGL